MTKEGNGEGGAAIRRTRAGRWLIGLLAASLAVNLFVAGWVGVRWASWAWGWHQFDSRSVYDGRDGRHGARSFDRALARDLIREHGPEGFAIASQSVPFLLQAADALEAEPFDAERFESAVSGLEALGQDLVSHFGVALRDGAGRLDEEQRRWIARRIHRSADRLERRVDRWDDRLLRIDE